MRLVVDTNVLITTINRSNPEFFIYEAFAKKQFVWVISNEILEEYYEKISEFYSSKTADFIVSILCNATNVLFAEPYFKWWLITEDADDNKFVDIAFASNSDALITYDKHFNILKTLPFPKVTVFNPNELRTLFVDKNII